VVSGTAEGVVATRREERGERLQNRDRAPMLINNDDGTTTSCLHVKEQCSWALELHRLRCPVETAATNNISLMDELWFGHLKRAAAAGALLQSSSRNALATTSRQMSSISNKHTPTLMEVAVAVNTRPEPDQPEQAQARVTSYRAQLPGAAFSVLVDQIFGTNSLANASTPAAMRSARMNRSLRDNRSILPSLDITCYRETIVTTELQACP
jgi:hypothetical protein